MTVDDDRFWSKVRVGDGCWLWTASPSRRYGAFWIGDRATGRDHAAHRVSWQMAHGTITEGMEVLHCCDTPRCVRPSHLFLGTQLQNIADMVAKGRAARRQGEAAPRARLTAEQVRHLRASPGCCYAEVARRLGVSETAVRHAAIGLTWRSL